ncbi:hypothetical protein [Fontimonas thermophila]|uniref:hypothetical protein n=1 Tax=Fontimonas thermophila TaxID=1076937 RepID=UPI000B86DA14|nr:hypothetical protein [Fontimonas thermophila]
MLGTRHTFIVWHAIGPTLAVLFGAGVVIGLLFPSLAGLAGWLMLGPILLVGGALVFAVVTNVIGRLIR